MKPFINKTVAISFFLYIFTQLPFPCTMVLVGKKASATGQVLLAHNNDLTGNEAAYIQFIPGKIHPVGSTIIFGNSCVIPQVRKTLSILITHCYYGYAEGDAKAINEKGVSIAGGVSLKDDRKTLTEKKDPLVKIGMTGYIRYIALQRAGSARECVEIIGKHYSRYGIAYPCGVGIADSNEVWYLEAGGGKAWAAIRVPKNTYLAVANGYRIGVIDFNNKRDFILPKYLQDYLIKQKLWAPKKGPCNFQEIFGGQRHKSHQKYYDSRRVWRVQSILTPSLRTNPNYFFPPLFLKPDKKINLQILKQVLRDRYYDTPFRNNEKERKIGSFLTVHSTIIVLKKSEEHKDIPVMWTAIATPLVSPFLPFRFGEYKIPPPYSYGPKTYSLDSAFWIFRKLALYIRQDQTLLKKYQRNLEQFEAAINLPQDQAMESFLKLLSRQAIQQARKDLKRLRKLHWREI